MPFWVFGPLFVFSSTPGTKQIYIYFLNKSQPPPPHINSQNFEAEVLICCSIQLVQSKKKTV